MALDNIESIYPLSPMQESMLFYAQSRISAKNSGINSSALTEDVLFNQSNIDIEGHLDVKAFKQAWQYVVDANTAFRTGFLWEGLQQAQQYVRKSIDLPFEYCDLSKVDDQEREAQLQHKLQDDLKTGFNLQKAPLLRVLLVKLAEDKFRLVWSSHHLIIDRWCIPLVFEQLNTYYDAIVEKTHLPNSKPPPYKAYIAWRHKKNDSKSLQYWQQNLRGFNRASLLCNYDANASEKEHQFTIEPALLESIKDYCRRQKLTLANLFQSAWALALNQVLGRQDVLFGLVVSGRPSQIKDVENIIGTFVNNVPLRITMPKHSTLAEWLSENQTQSYYRYEHEHESVLTLHQFTQLPSDETLFDHVLVWQNQASLSSGRLIKFTPKVGKLKTAYPLTISIEEKPEGLHITAQVQAKWKLLDAQALFLSLKDALSSLCSTKNEQQLCDLFHFVLDDGFQEAQASEDVKNETQQAPSGLKPGKQKYLDKVVTGRTTLSQNVMEEFLMREWKSILERDDIGVDDDFFELGGSSLKAAQLVSRVEQAEQKHIPIIRLFEGRTIRSMAKVYLQNDWSIKPDWTTPVNTKGKGAPLFFIASPEVNTIGYAQLVRELGADVSAYIVQPPPQSEHIRQVRTKDMPELSLKFIDEIKQVQATGPYHIIGMCSGAHIGAEIVRQMEKQTLEVAFFGVINTWSLYTISALYHFEKVIDLYRMLRYYTRRLSNLQWQEIKNRFLPALKKRLLKSETHKNDDSIDVEKVEAKQDAKSKGPVRQYDETVVPIQEEKWASERPADLVKIKSNVTVFRIQDKPYWRINTDALGWEYLAQNVELIYLKETVHDAILRDPHISHFAGQLKSVLNRPQDK